MNVTKHEVSRFGHRCCVWCLNVCLVLISDGVAMTLGSCGETHHKAPFIVTWRRVTGCCAWTEDPLPSFRLSLMLLVLCCVTHRIYHRRLCCTIRHPLMFVLLLRSAMLMLCWMYLCCPLMLIPCRSCSLQPLLLSHFHLSPSIVLLLDCLTL